VFPDYYLGVSVLVAEFSRRCSFYYGRLALPYSNEDSGLLQILAKRIYSSLLGV
jgi:hypothetical protein